MTRDDLAQLYGDLIACRVSQELRPVELEQVVVEDVVEYLEIRADEANRLYQQSIEKKSSLAVCMHNTWVKAEELAYLVRMAQSVVEHTERRVAVRG